MWTDVACCGLGAQPACCSTVASRLSSRATLLVRRSSRSSNSLVLMTGTPGLCVVMCIAESWSKNRAEAIGRGVMSATPTTCGNSGPRTDCDGGCIFRQEEANPSTARRAKEQKHRAMRQCRAFFAPRQCLVSGQPVLCSFARARKMPQVMGRLLWGLRRNRSFHKSLCCKVLRVYVGLFAAFCSLLRHGFCTMHK
jgi:hypothetical protein